MLGEESADSLSRSASRAQQRQQARRQRRPGQFGGRPGSGAGPWEEEGTGESGELYSDEGSQSCSESSLSSRRSLSPLLEAAEGEGEVEQPLPASRPAPQVPAVRLHWRQWWRHYQ